MPSNYNGSSAGRTAADAVTISNPDDGEAATAASNASAPKTLADFVKFVLEAAGFLAVARTWTALQTFSVGIISEGTSSTAGVWGKGINGNAGVAGSGVSGDTPGVRGNGFDSGSGVEGNGGTTGAGSGNGVVGYGGSPDGNGVYGAASGGGSSGYFDSRGGTGPGVTVFGGGSSPGITTEGAIGVLGTGSATSGIGVKGIGSATGPAVQGYNSSGGIAGAFTSTGAAYALTITADTTTPVKSALRIEPQDTDPSSGLKGDIYVNTDGTLRIHDGSNWVKVGTQT